MTALLLPGSGPRSPQDRRNGWEPLPTLLEPQTATQRFYRPRGIPDPCPDISPEYRDWWYSLGWPKVCHACGSSVDVQLHHLRYRRNQRVWDFVPLCRGCHVGLVHEEHRAKFDRSEPAPSRSGIPHPMLAAVTWRVVRRQRRRYWWRDVPTVPWENQPTEVEK